MTLLDLKIDTPAEIIAINCDNTQEQVLHYLFSLGFAVGAKITVTNRGILSKNPCAVLIDNNENMIMLRASEAKIISVKEISQ